MALGPHYLQLGSRFSRIVQHAHLRAAFPAGKGAHILQRAPLDNTGLRTQDLAQDMAWRWQLWLSPRPKRRTAASSESRIMTAHGAALFEFFTEENGHFFVRETHYMDNPIVRKGLSGPLLHIHWSQDEYFKVEKGVIGIMKNEVEHVATKDSEVQKIPRGTRHRFWAHASGNEDLVFKVWAEPQGQDNGFDEVFLRNFMGYQRDCQREGLEPSIWQLLLMSYESSTVATPPFWVPLWLLRAVQYVMAYGIAKRILGYQSSYPEYTQVAEDQPRRSNQTT